MTGSTILEHLQSSLTSPPAPPLAWSRWPWLLAGLSTQHGKDGYYWDGLKRSPIANGSFLVFQYTLRGKGLFETPHERRTVSEGSAFFAYVPSEHVYHLPPDWGPWTFFYLLITHPYVVERIGTLTRREGVIWALGDGALLTRRSADLVESACLRSFSDEFAEETAILEWMMECEREAAVRRSENAAPSLLFRTRELVLATLPRVLTTSEIAEAFGMSRSHFGHYFRRLAGVTPGRFARDVRLQLAADLLRTTRHPVKQVAETTGFPDVPTLHKAFRSRFGFTPHQIRSGAG